MAIWWDEWKINLRQILLATTKNARQGTTKSYRQRLSRLYARLDAALLATRSPNVSPTSGYESGGQSSFVDPSAETPVNLRRGVSECRRSFQLVKKERLLLQHTYSHGGTSRRVYAHMLAKFKTTPSFLWKDKPQLVRTGLRNWPMKCLTVGSVL